MKEKKKLTKIELVGIDDTIFKNLKSKLIEKVEKVLDSSIDMNTERTIKEEIQRFSSLGLAFAESKLKKAGIENENLIAEIEEKFSIIEKNKAETRKINAEAKVIEFNHNLRELSFTLKMAKVLIMGQNGDEAVAFIKQIDSFMEVINSLNEVKRI